MGVNRLSLLFCAVVLGRCDNFNVYDGRDLADGSSDGIVAVDHGDAGTTGDSGDAVLSSCAALLSLQPSTVSGMYTIDPDGPGPIAPFLAYCDMTFAGGGWTLFFSTASDGTGAIPGPSGMAAGIVALGSTTYMAAPAVLALAATATQVHVRTAGHAETRSITSVAGSFAIQALRGLHVLNWGDGTIGSSTSTVTDWTGPMATAPTLWFACGFPPYPGPPPANSDYPALYWPCGNSSGMAIENSWATWDYAGPNEPIEAYVR